LSPNSGAKANINHFGLVPCVDGSELAREIRQACKLSMLESEVLHSLNTSAMQADCSAADGLNSASAVLGAAKSTKQIAPTIPLRMVFMAFPLA
jgi:hypothetical protein